MIKRISSHIFRFRVTPQEVLESFMESFLTDREAFPLNDCMIVRPTPRNIIQGFKDWWEGFSTLGTKEIEGYKCRLVIPPRESILPLIKEAMPKLIEIGRRINERGGKDQEDHGVAISSSRSTRGHQRPSASR